jgi:sialate O-acetylesterase
MIKFHPLCTDHAVIAARCPRIMGEASPGSMVTVSLAGASAKATTADDGTWNVTLPPLSPGGPHTLSAEDTSGLIIARDVLLGEVWLGSGQSNMEWSLGATKDSEPDIDAADDLSLRIFTVAKAQSPSGPTRTVEGRWQVCSPKEAPTMSAVGYFFGRKMTGETGLPFGVIVSAWGGSCISPWMPEEVFSARPEYKSFLTEIAQARVAGGPSEEAFKPYDDPGITADAKGWAKPNFDDSAWPILNVPGQWQNEGWDFNGAVWFRRTVEIPAEWVGQDLELSLGIVDDFDRSFVNGVQVGAMGPETPNWWSTPRFHTIPAELVTETTLHLAIRVFDIWGQGGIMGYPTIRPIQRPEAPPLPISGRWKAHSEIELPLRASGGPPLAPASLWNAMIYPLLNYTINGIIWYQGESDTSRSSLYARLLTDLINVWRRAFQSPELPFGIVQLANHMPRKEVPSEDDWANLRDAQRRVALHVPACGLALAIDAGEADDIHPRYKKVVGERLALWALHQTYGRKDLAYSGPLPAEAWSQANGIAIRFIHAEGLRVRGNALRGFQVAGHDRRWHWAEASLSGDTAFVHSSEVPAPVAVRYAWQANPETTLENGAGLPASPFRTDSWIEFP